MKLLFVPVSVVAGLLAGQVGSRVFQHVWSWVDDEEPPDSSIRSASFPRLLVAAALEGAIFKVTKSIVDRELRQGFSSVFGSWPGQEHPEESP